VQRALTEKLTDPLEAWMWRLEQSIATAPTRLEGPIRTDYDEMEVAQGRSLRVVRRLVGLRARVAMSLALPPLPRGMHLEAGRGEFQVVGPGQGQQEPLVHLLEEALDAATVRLIVLPELIASDQALLESDDWASLGKEWSVREIRCRIEALGVVARVELELEAS
jgi:hypothetical protein